MENNTFQGQLYLSTNINGESSTNTIEIMNSHFGSTRSSNIIAAFNQGFSPSFSVNGNTFITPLHYTSMQLQLRNGGSIQIEDNSFQSSGRSLIITSWRTYSSEIEQTTLLARNKFTDNSNNAAIQLTQYYNPSDHLWITENAFVNNSAGKDTVIQVRGYDAHFQWNQFDNPGAAYDVKFTSGYNENEEINATLNWWGSSDYATISSRIYANHLDTDITAVIFNPFLKSNNKSDVGDVEEGFFQSPTEIGGELTEDVTLHYIGEPYRVIRQIVIPPEFSLVIEPGVQLEFSGGGITVEGQCEEFSLHL